MPTEVARNFRSELNNLQAALLATSPSLADTPWRPGGWTRKQIVGHLLDSAANNRQRFVRAETADSYSGPQYEQDAWVSAHGYASRTWAVLLRWWQVEHEILMEIVDRIPEDKLGTSCQVGDDAPVTLRFLIEDYVRHQEHHFKQITTGTKARRPSLAKALLDAEKPGHEPGSFACLDLSVAWVTSLRPSWLPSWQELS